MKKALLVINEQHSILPDQERVLKLAGYEYEEFKIPAKGMTLAEMREAVDSFPAWSKIIFLSPVPAMMSMLNSKGKRFRVFHNDNREKKELANGKIIMTVAKEGWELV